MTEHHSSSPPGAGRQEAAGGSAGRRGVAAAAARLTSRLRWPLLVLWIVALAVSGTGAMSIADSLSGGGWFVSGSDSDKAAARLEHGFTGRGQVTVTLVVHDRRYGATAPQFEQRVRSVAKAVTAEPALKATDSYGWTTLSRQNRTAFQGKDGHTATVSVALDRDDGSARRELPKVQKDLTGRFDSQGLDVSLVSPASFWGEINTLSQQGLMKAELITLPLIVVILLYLFRGVVAALASLAVGITAIVLTLGVLAPLAAHTELSVFVENAATMLGLGVGVDYSLFMITRFKEELAAGKDVEAAVAETLRTSGHTVVASGITIAMAMCTLFLIDLNVIFSIALGSVVVVAFSVLSSVLFLPVLLHFLGHRVNNGRVRMPWRSRTRASGSQDMTSDRWYRTAVRVMNRPVLFLVGTTVVLLAIASPAVQLRTFSPDSRIIPHSSPVRVGYDEVQKQFGVGTTSPVQVVVTSSRPLQDLPQSDQLLRLRDDLSALPHVAHVQSGIDTLKKVSPQAPFAALAGPRLAQLPPDARNTVRHYVAADNRVTVLEVIPDDRSSSDAVRTLLHDVRERSGTLSGPLHAVVGGEAAEGIDANQVIQDHLIEVIGLMLVAVFIVLMLAFRSLLLPVKAIAMNLLSIGATYGVLVLVFQKGFGTGLLGFQKTDYLQNFVPVLLLALLFSLSTDYEVFLLGRVREEYLVSGDNTASVARGLTRTAPLISGAAALMVAVFGAFGFAGIVPIQQLGFGMAIAVLLDATLVRLVLVPAAMRLMGRWNWWMPGRPDPGGSAADDGTHGAASRGGHPAEYAGR
ncbi:MMPL family transporter [Streptomyces sp. SID10853]|uniref:MMPL family transporter n=1 Tax=Streptomyces sp. SID10853 TaxID=2706028 RepID=UPI0013C0E324|nr:MMPL family transporter [Streptomyces sp. SID10853]NDZ80945.1 MMPL family transporter [Streptomyces sp. SID10853]